MDDPREPGGPPLPPGSDSDPEAVRAFLLAAFIIIAGMMLWALAMIGY